MDQIVCSMGGVVGIDFKDAQNLEIDKLDFNFDATHHVVCVIDSGAHHQDLALEYTAITREMHVVADYFGKDYLRDVELKHFLKELGRMRQEGIADRAILRAFHFFKESQRA